MKKLNHYFANESFLFFFLVINIFLIEILHFMSLQTALILLTMTIALLKHHSFKSLLFIAVYFLMCTMIIAFFSMYPRSGVYKVSDVSSFSMQATNNFRTVHVRLSSDHGYSVNDEIQIDGPFELIENNDFSTSFNPKRHYNSKAIYYSADKDAITVNGRSFDLDTTRILLSLVDESLHVYYDWFFGGEIDPDIREHRQLLSKLSLIHIFVISGFHITLVAKLLNKYIKNDKIIMFLLVLILIWLQFSISAFRAILYYILLSQLQRYQVSKQVILSYVAIVLMSINPVMTLSLGYRLSIGITFFLLYLNQNIKNKYHSFMVFQLFILSIIIFMQYEIALLYFILPMIVTPIYIVIVILMGVNLILPIDVIVLMIIDNFFSILSHIESFTPFILFGKPTLIWMYLYCLAIYVYIKYQRIRHLILVMMLICYKYSVSSLYGYVTYIDVGQGDSILIKPPMSNQAILIDTGGSIRRDIATDNLIPYFKRENLKSITTVLISHDDFDHSGALASLIANYDVKQVILPHTETFHFKNGSLYELDTRVPLSSDNNDNSRIFLYNTMGSSFLFTGDATAVVEHSLYQHESMFSVNYLKVAHHGSNTSTTDLFLRQTNPEYAIISVGFNHYGHPHPQVIRRLQQHNVNILTTKAQGSIKVVPLPFYDFIFTNNKIIVNRKN